MARLIFLYLILFPFGQLIKIGVHPVDILALIMALQFLFKRKSSLFLKQSVGFIFVCLFSLVFSLIFFDVQQILTGVLYFGRFVIYLIFTAAIVGFIKAKPKYKDHLIRSLLVVGTTIAIFGWAQYLIFPDLRSLKGIGWDDHYFRLVSTFLDPTFTGLILVLTILILLTVNLYPPSLKFRRGFTLLHLGFLVTTLAFTYSRNSYLALIFAILFLVIYLKKKIMLGVLVILFFLLPVLPRPGGEGVNLARVNSVNQKFDDYKSAVNLFIKSPILGVGFNNLCIAKKDLLKQSSDSHSCSGLDNGFLVVLITTGVAGITIFIKFVIDVLKNTSKNNFGILFYASGIALLVHTMFVNSLFYPWILGWLGILIAVSRKAKE